MPSSRKPARFSPEILCQQLHLLHDLLDARKAEILADPEFNEGNEPLMNELDRIYKRHTLILECFEEFCPS